MANRKSIPGVTVRLHPNFFDGWFEKERKAMETKMKIPITQLKFTEILSKSQIKVNTPKSLTMDTKYFPKPFKHRRLI
jgi:hypothetical protein